MTTPSIDLLRRFDLPGPRYTSYPTADRFVEAYGLDDHLKALAARRGALGATPQPLSLYVHLPFCQSLCYFCACNKIVTRRPERAVEYLDYLAREIDLYVQRLGRGQPVSQLHLGGGTPTYLDDEQLSGLLELLRGAFQLEKGGEYSIEVDPRTVDGQRIEVLARMGFNRISFGVQDFDADVQKAVHRIQPRAMVADLVGEARRAGFESINTDLIYGLPRQTPESFARTVHDIAGLRPDRIALYGYAHLPERFKPQRRIHSADLPTAGEKIRMLSHALEALQAAGYVHVGMDHFALPGDALAIARRQGRLHRNFQGYSTQPDCDLIGLGVSSIGRIGPAYSQNAKTLEDYYDSLDQGRLPVARGYMLSRDDLARRAVIMSIMCQGQVVFESIELAWLLDFRSYFAQELKQVREYERMGLLAIDDAGFQVTPQGWYVVRAIAMVFDRHLQSERQRAQFSRII